MTPPPADTPPRSPAWKPLVARQRRVLGVLIEKAKTTPAGYPMTVNAIVTGCNQKNNRDPLTALDDIEVEQALDQLRTLGVVSEIDWLGRAAKYKHHAYEWLGVSKPEIAVMTELLLRGAQALGDLRARAARMEPIADLTELKPIVDGLVARGLMIELTPPGRGQVVSHNLYLSQELAEVKAQHSGGARPHASVHDGGTQVSPARAIAEPPATATRGGSEAATGERLAALEAGVSELRVEVARLRDRVRDLESRPG